MYQIEMSGPFHITAVILLGKRSLVPIEYEDGWATEIVWIMWSKKPTRCHLVLYLFLLYKLLNMFQATLCPSSEADDLVVFLPHVV